MKFSKLMIIIIGFFLSNDIYSQEGYRHHWGHGPHRSGGGGGGQAAAAAGGQKPQPAPKTVYCTPEVVRDLNTLTTTIQDLKKQKDEKVISAKNAADDAKEIANLRSLIRSKRALFLERIKNCKDSSQESYVAYTIQNWPPRMGGRMHGGGQGGGAGRHGGEHGEHGKGHGPKSGGWRGCRKGECG